MSIHDLCLLSWYLLPPFIRPQPMMRSSTAGGIIGAANHSDRRPHPHVAYHPAGQCPLRLETCSVTGPCRRENLLSDGSPECPRLHARPRAPAAGHKHICHRPRPSASCPWRGSSGPFLTGAQDQTPTPQSNNTCGGTPPLMYVDGNIWFTPTSHRHSLYTSYLFFLWSEIETLAGKRMDIYHFIFKKR